MRGARGRVTEGNKLAKGVHSDRAPGTLVTRTDHRAAQIVREGVRGMWRWFFQETNEEDAKAIIRQLLEDAKLPAPKGNKPKEIFFKYAMGPGAELVDDKDKPAILVAIQNVFEQYDRPASAEEAAAIEGARDGWVYTEPDADADSSASVENEAGGGWGEGGEVEA
jgi:hypothetical protein